jgi:signal transduction histidine kinase
LSLLENLLQWSRLQMGRIEYEPKRIDLQHLATETVNLLSETAKSKGITLQSTVVHDTWIYGDENMLNIVIRNLTNNALKFTPAAGQVTISAQDSRQQTADSRQENSSTSYLLPFTHYVEVWVSDTGVGMKAEDRAKLFQTGVHHSTIGTANEKGTGLGLILCKEMIERNGGRIWVESELGHGTTVKFTVQLK